MSAIEIGLGGEIRNPQEIAALGGSPDLAGAALYRWYNDQVRALDPLVRVECLEGLPTADEAAAAADCGMPFRGWTDLYILRGHGDRPPALELLKRWLDVAIGLKTITCLNMQVAGNAQDPSIAELVEFHQQADALAAGSGILITSETHIHRYTEDPRRLLAVHRALQQCGHPGLSIGADFSHYAHQIGNSHAITAAAQRDGSLRLDPLAGDDLISREIIAPGLIGHAHLRMAAPCDLPRERGAVQYPVTDPGLTMRHHGPWRPERRAAWTHWYRQVMHRHLQESGRRTLCMTSEFIDCEDEYRMDRYSNLAQNLAMVVYAQRLRREVSASLSPASQQAQATQKA